MPLALTDFDQTGHDPDALALFVAASPPDWYRDSDLGGSQSPESGEMGLGDGETLIASLRWVSNNRVALLDRDNPQALTLSDWFGSSGTSRWTLHIQTDNGEVSSNQVHSAGGNVVRMQFTHQDAHAVLNRIGSGDRVIVAVTRPTLPLAASLAGVAGSITAALGKQAAGTLQVAAGLAGVGGSITAALGKQAGATLPLAASLAGVAGSITADLNKQAPGTLQVAASLAGAGGSLAAALGKQALGSLPVAASLAGAGGSVTAALGKRAPDPPRAVLVASQASVVRGRAVELRWAAAHAESVEIDQGIGAVPPSGSIRVSPEVSTTWTLTASARGLSAVSLVTVTVLSRTEQQAVRFASLLPPNATAFERALEAALAQNVEVPIRKLWSAADCPVELLPYLAWALGVEEWDPLWPVAVKRAAVANAFAVHREKGTLAGLKRVLSTAGAEYEYTERPAGVAMTAKLSILNSNAVYLPNIARAVNRVKRASLKLDIELLSAATGEIPIAAGLGAATVVEISDWSGYTV